MIDFPHDIVPYAFFFIALIFVLALKKNTYLKKNQNTIEKKLPVSLIDDQTKRKVLEEAESRLIALKDLYKQELIDSKIYISKTELIVNNISDQLGNEIMQIPKIKENLIFNDLKQEIRRKVNIDNKKHIKTDIDNLISAIDKRIKIGNIYEEK